MSSTIFATVKEAIQHKRIVTGRYHGHYREMCPHTLGWSKAGKERALFYQFAGTSDSGLGPDGSYQNWRCIDLDELTGIAVREGLWHTAANHNRRQTCVAVVDTEVAY